MTKHEKLQSPLELVQGTTNPEPSTNSLDLANLRINQDFASTVGVKKIRTEVPIRKPSKHEFFRVHPSEDYSVTLPMYQNKEDGISDEFFAAAKSVLGAMPDQLKPFQLVLVINRQKAVYLWPMRLPTDDERASSWITSRMDAAQKAKEKWIRMVANTSPGAGYYDIFEAQGNLGEPEWPEETFQELINIAFRNRLIDCADHPIIKNLLGL
jgi:hypothetical protein